MRSLAVFALALTTLSLLAAESASDTQVTQSDPAAGAEQLLMPLRPRSLPQPEWSLPALEEIAGPYVPQPVREPTATRFRTAGALATGCYFIKQLNPNLKKPLDNPVFMPLATQPESAVYVPNPDCLPDSITWSAMLGR
jgi:hypothetical protein